MTVFKYLLIGIFFIFTTQSLADETSDKKAVKDTLIAMWAAVEEGDITKYASFIHPNFTVFGEYDPYLQSGKENEVRSYGSYLKRARNVHTEMHQEEITIIGNVAWITYYWTDEGFTDEGRFTSRGKSTRIFVKEDGRWLSRHGHYTAIE